MGGTGVGTGRFFPPRYVAHIYDGHTNHWRYGFMRWTAHLRGILAARHSGGAVMSVSIYLDPNI